MSYSKFLCANTSLPVGQFSAIDPAVGIPKQWEALTFQSIDRHTHYTAISLNGRTVIEAKSASAASGLIRKISVATSDYPWISWHWRVNGTLDAGDVTTKQGDDCPARIYVAFKFVSEGKTFWERFQHRAACITAGKELPGSALTYIWANQATRGAIIDSPYTGQSKMVVVRSGNTRAGQWIKEKRNILDDYQAAFGQAAPQISGIAIMTDTDNTKTSTITYYGDIWLDKGNGLK